MKTAFAMLFATVWMLAGSGRTLAACDYSFILRQPIFRLVAPEESSINASLSTLLAVASDDGDFSSIKQIQLVPDVGATIVLAPKLKPLPKDQGLHGSAQSGSSTVATMALPELNPSTTYQVVLMVRTVSAPTTCPRALTERIARFTTESATSLDALALQRAKAAVSTPGKLNGPQIFENALQELHSLTYPPYVSFLVTTHSSVDGKPFVESFRSLVRIGDDLVVTHPIPVSSTNKPESPFGFNINIPILSQLFRHRNPDRHDEPFGVPEISPVYTFGLRPRAPLPQPGARTPAKDADVPTLARIRTVARNYDATLIGVERDRNRAVYHLKLQPLGDPGQYRIREAWVDTNTFIIWRLKMAGIFPSGPASTIPWDIEYTAVDGHWFIARESTASSVHTGGGFLADTAAARYDGISYAFSDFTYPRDLFDFDFFSEVKTDAIQY